MRDSQTTQALREGLGQLDELRPGDARLVVVRERAEWRRKARLERSTNYMVYKKAWVAKVMQDKMPSGPKLCATVMADHLDESLFINSGRLECYPSVRYLAQKMNVSKSTAMRYVQVLIDRGHLAKKPGGYNREKNQQRPNRYRCQWEARQVAAAAA